MSDYLDEENKGKFSEQTIFRALKRKGITWKKTTPRYLEQIPLLGNISKYTDKVKLLPQSQIIALDECGFNLSETSRYSWSFRGSRSFILKPGQRGFNHTLILCIRNVKKEGVIGYELIENKMGKKKGER